jgi:membrane-bound serine protease (ClpP class)
MRPHRGKAIRVLIRLAAVATAAFAPAAAAVAATQPGPTASRVLVSTVDAAITPVIADHIADGIDKAERGRFAAYVVRLDTPGGLETSMRDIIQDILAARVPVIVYVSPQGGRAASAGALITFAAHVAAMAPGTTIGASTPIDLSGGGDLDRKIVNDATAYAESLARLRNRDVAFARATVQEGRSAPATEAADLRAVDFVAPTLAAVLDQADGRTTTLGDGPETVTIRTADADIVDHDMGFLRSLQLRLADPNLAYLFLSIGTLALVYELAQPGVGMGGVTGAVLILLALYALSVLPVDFVGVAFIGLAAALFVAEVVAPGIGVFAAGGSICLVLGGIFLFRDRSGFEVSVGLVIPIALVVGAAVVLAGRLALKARRAPANATPGAFTDRTVEVRRVDGRKAQANVDGAWWNLRADNVALEPGMRVRVVDIDGLDLVVEPVDAQPREQEPTEQREVPS